MRGNRTPGPHEGLAELAREVRPCAGDATESSVAHPAMRVLFHGLCASARFHHVRERRDGWMLCE